MAQSKVYPSWKEMQVPGTNGPTHQNLIETDGFKAVLVSLRAGEKIPSHPAAAAVYHILEGSGWMIVDGERFALEPGATVVVPAGVPRGVEAESLLSFLGAHGTAQGQNRKPSMKLSLPIMLGVMLMFGLMIGWMIVPARMMSRIAGLGLGMWGVMLIPLFGMVAMFIMMFFFFRRMARNRGAPELMSGHDHIHARPSARVEDSETALAFGVPSVNCGHCNMTIERAVGEIRGVASVHVDVENQQVVVRFDSPATQAEIETVLAEIGHPPEGLVN